MSWPDSHSKVNPIGGTILHVNISPGGIPKRPVREAYLAPTGLEGDACAHPRIHGGPLKAVLLIMAETLDELRGLGYELFPGALGENFTVAGLDRRQIRFGDRYRAGAAVIEITKLRNPCPTLDVYNAPGLPAIQDLLSDQQARLGDPASPNWGRGGFYARVVQGGLVRSGDPISFLDALA